MGKKKSSTSKKQLALAAAVEEAEQNMEKVQLNGDGESELSKNSKQETPKKGQKKKSKNIENEDKEELKFDYTGGENTEEDESEKSG